ncbi:MAG TPA: molybdopterin-dependent oxidoreductase, partial [Cyclobacteriaceae bacterium]|nr:molybdopterin-dependent oxidoreductase [Cyclobacteriaceae bacterium]
IWEPLRHAGAVAREMLLNAGAEKFNIDKTLCRISSGYFTTKDERRCTIGELIEIASKLEVPPRADLKTEDFEVLGRNVKRVDGSQVVNGTRVFSIDYKVEGMLYASVERCPHFGGKVESFDGSTVKAIDGIVDVVEVQKTGAGSQVRSGVAIVGKNYWTVEKARKHLTIKWDEPVDGGENSNQLSKQMFDLVSAAGRKVKEVGEPFDIVNAAGYVVTAQYEVPFVSHAQMEPMNCIAHVEPDKVTIWGPLQFPEWAVMGISRALGVKADTITVHVLPIGGGFGRRINFDYAVEAALISQKVNAPVKVIWTREDDFRHGFYRPAAVHRMHAELDEIGNPKTWYHHLVSTTINVWGNSSDASNETLGGLAGDLVYSVPQMRTEYSGAKSLVNRGWWRSVEYSFNIFAVESFIDELAHAAKKDPVEYRLNLIKKRNPFDVTHPFWGTKTYDPARHARVLETVKAKADWMKNKKRSQGVATYCHFGLDAYIALVAEVIPANGLAFTVKKIIAIVDAGMIINPLGAKAQIEGGILFGLSAAMKEQITISDGAVLEGNFDKYYTLRMKEAPEIDIVFEQGSGKPGGLGELAVPVVAPAVANAIFAATGMRRRRLPLMGRKSE